jgi:hypothetical protein
VDDVRLPDLEVIKRFSIAVRREHAPAEEVVAALRADLAAITGRGRERTTTAAARPKPAARAKPAASRTPARAAARKKTKRR